MTDERTISDEKAKRTFGIVPNHRVMPNGELRFSLRAADGNAYIRTQTKEGGWQNSHSHQHCRETYIVERGWMGFATLDGDRSAKIVIYEVGAVFTTHPLIPHNVYLPADAIIHTVKHQAAGADRDWDASKELDGKTHPLNEMSILERGKRIAKADF